MPEAINSVEPKNRGDSLIMQKGNLVATAWNDKNVVTYLCTNCDSTQERIIQRRQKKRNKKRRSKCVRIVHVLGWSRGSKEDAVLYLQAVDNVLNGNALIDQVDPENREIFSEISLMIWEFKEFFSKAWKTTRKTFTFEDHGFRKPSMRLRHSFN